MKLPSKPVDGQVAIDQSGTRYRYVARLNQWIDEGETLSTELVTIKSNGLVSPEIATALQKLNSFTTFKIYQNPNTYYYLISPAKGFYQTSVESGDIRLEINRAYLTNTLFAKACQGEAGPQGYDGLAGRDGLAGPAELSYQAVVHDTTLTVSTSMPAPLDTEISLRLFQDDAQKVEIWLETSGTTGARVIQTDVELESYSLSYEDGVFSATVVAKAAWGSGWKAKVRQRGPDGWGGANGEAFLDIVEVVVDNIQSKSAVMLLRNFSEDLRKISRTLTLETLAAAHLRPYNNVVLDASFDYTSQCLSVSPSVDSSKLLLKWGLEIDSTAAEILNLPLWVPDPSCVRPNTDPQKAAPVNYDWYSSLGVGLNSGDPKLVQAPPLEVKCCQEDFYFCPNIMNIRPDPCPPSPPSSSSSEEPSSSSSEESSSSSEEESSSSSSEGSSSSSSEESSSSSSSSEESSSSSSEGSSSSSGSGGSSSSSSSSAGVCAEDYYASWDTLANDWVRDGGGNVIISGSTPGCIANPCVSSTEWVWDGNPPGESHLCTFYWTVCGDTPCTIVPGGECVDPVGPEPPPPNFAVNGDCTVPRCLWNGSAYWIRSSNTWYDWNPPHGLYILWQLALCYSPCPITDPSNQANWSVFEDIDDTYCRADVSVCLEQCDPNSQTACTVGPTLTTPPFTINSANCTKIVPP